MYCKNCNMEIAAEDAVKKFDSALHWWWLTPLLVGVFLVLVDVDASYGVVVLAISAFIGLVVWVTTGESSSGSEIWSAGSSSSASS